MTGAPGAAARTICGAYDRDAEPTPVVTLTQREPGVDHCHDRVVRPDASLTPELSGTQREPTRCDTEIGTRAFGAGRVTRKRVGSPAHTGAKGVRRGVGTTATAVCEGWAEAPGPTVEAAHPATTQATPTATVGHRKRLRKPRETAGRGTGDVTCRTALRIAPV